MRYRVDARPLPEFRSRPDVLFPRARIAIFVDGCFWHACPIHGTIPKSNREWWLAKFKANVARDEANSARLIDAGWRVIRVWEHEDPVLAVDHIETFVRNLDVATE